MGPVNEDKAGPRAFSLQQREGLVRWLLDQSDSVGESGLADKTHPDTTPVGVLIRVDGDVASIRSVIAVGRGDEQRREPVSHADLERQFRVAMTDETVKGLFWKSCG